ncbi:MAG: D-glycero-beta-D-manno-heptose 1,7-bisphosphate 7-phosphatase [Pyrinomonadaceae bacterium]
MTRLVLIDRDGTLNVEQNYLSAPDQIELIPQSADGIRILRNLDLRIVVVTNQSGIGRGFFDAARLVEIHNRLREVLRENGTNVDAIYFCPHAPEDKCNCRKPMPGMAKRAATEFNADLSKSFVIGDNVCDIELGKNIGATTILVRTGYGKMTETESETKPDYIAGNLFEAARLIKEILEKDGISTE